jgi:hypothetical protein
MVVQRGDDCGDICQQQLYQTRQIHLALGKEFNRVGRIVLSDNSPAAVTLAPGIGDTADPVIQQLDDWLAREHVGILPLTLPTRELEGLVPEILTAPAQWYVVDPAGWIMMRVADDIHYKDVISDMRFLLKNSGS